MATGMRVLPGALVATEFRMAAGRVVTAEQAIRAEPAVAACPSSAAGPPAGLRGGVGGRRKGRSDAGPASVMNAFPRRAFHKPCTPNPE